MAHEVPCHVDYVGARERLKTLRIAGDRFAIAPQVVNEFVHVVTDAGVSALR